MISSHTPPACHVVQKGITLHTNFMKDDITPTVFEQGTAAWVDFTINGKVLARKGCFEGEVMEGGVRPWLRCPSIEHQTIYPYSPLVLSISERIKALTGHETNIAKIQRYDSGRTGIYLHSDKIIDLDEKTPIFVARFGAERMCLLQNKESGEVIELPVPHNSLLVIDYEANLKWKHGIKQDATLDPSYSVVFRKTVTFLHPSGFIFGSRTPFKSLSDLEGYLVEQAAGRCPRTYFSRAQQSEEMVACYKNENKNVAGLDLYKKVIDNCIYPF